MLEVMGYPGNGVAFKIKYKGNKMISDIFRQHSNLVMALVEVNLIFNTKRSRKEKKRKEKKIKEKKRKGG